MTAFGGLLLYYSFLGGDGLQGAGSAPDVGWFAYAPLTERAFSRGHSTDFWAALATDSLSGFRLHRWRDQEVSSPRHFVCAAKG